MNSLYGHNLPVDRTYHQIFRVAAIGSIGASEKIEYEGIHQQRKRRQECRHNPRGQKEPDRHIHHQQDYEKENEDISSFVMYLHIDSPSVGAIAIEHKIKKKYWQFNSFCKKLIIFKC